MMDKMLKLTEVYTDYNNKVRTRKCYIKIDHISYLSEKETTKFPKGRKKKTISVTEIFLFGTFVIHVKESLKEISALIKNKK